MGYNKVRWISDRPPQNQKFVSRKRHSQTYPQKYHQNKQAILHSVEHSGKEVGRSRFVKNYDIVLPWGELAYGYDFLFNLEKGKIDKGTPNSKSEICK